jgi:GH43 family beta-xylosidase
MSTKSLFSLVLVKVIACGVSVAAQQPQHYFANPICEQADPWIVQDQGHYLACFSDANRAISVQRSDRLTVLGAKHVVWTALASGPASMEVWAPELHLLNGRWYIYFAASDGQNKNHRAWVLQSAGSDPFGPYTLHGPLYTGDDPGLSSVNRWAIDLTVFDSGNRLYAIWSGWRDEQDIQHLYIAPMKDPMTMAAPRVQICANDNFLWERVDESPDGRGLNEAPEVLQHAGRTFVTFSCSGSWEPSYKIGLLELKPGTDPLQPKNWIKYPKPVFASTAMTFGVGHNSFVKSPDGTEDWLIYHVKLDRQNDWRRAVFAQRFAWDANGLPDFGRPVASGQLLRPPSGENVHYVTGARHFQFRDTSDLEEWPYFGHHQLVRVEAGKLYLGELRGQPVNEYRSGEKVVFDSGQWTNFTMTTKILLLENHGQAGLLFRVNTPFVGYSGQRGYFAGINSKQRLVFGFFDGKLWHQIASAPLSQPLGAECEMKVTARRNEIEIDCNGQRVLQARDGTFDSGSIGLRVVDMDAAFSDVEITPMADGDATAPPLAEGK